MNGRGFICFAVALILLGSHAWSGELKSEATVRKEKPTTRTQTWNFFSHYKARVQQIEKDIAALPPETTATVVLLGDSITEGFKVTELGGLRVVNMGISGDQIAMDRPDGGVRNRVHLLKQARPAHIFLLIGINDFGSSKPLEKAKRQYEDLVKAIRETVPEARLHIQSILPTRGYFAFHNPTVKAMNSFLEDLAKRTGCDYVDVWSLMADAKGELRSDYTGDGLHLKPPAYEAWKSLLESRVRSGSSALHNK